jgi:hypothetical protein
MKPEGSLPRLQEPAISTYPKLHESNPYKVKVFPSTVLGGP